METELKEKSMFNWLSTLSLHTYGNQKSYPLHKINDPQKLGPNPDDKLTETPSHDDNQEPADSQTQKRIKLDDKSNVDDVKTPDVVPESNAKVCR